MGEMGKDQETVEEFITHNFDPFKNETTTKLNRPTLFKSAGMASYILSLERYQSAGATESDDPFDANRLIIAGRTEKKDHSTALDNWSALQIREIVFNCDQDNIVCKEEWGNVPDMDDGDFIDEYSSFNICLCILETDELKKIADASQLEIRVSTDMGHIDLSDEEEKDFQDSLKLFYNQVYDDKAETEEIEKIKEKVREKQEILKEVEAESGGCFIATAVYQGDDHFNLIVLRSFRDNFLDNYHYGKRFISFYYKFGPRLANMISDSKLLKLIFKPLVNLGVVIVKTLKLG